jgi:uncharacterized protein (TIGR03086 family)
MPLVGVGRITRSGGAAYITSNVSATSTLPPASQTVSVSRSHAFVHPVCGKLQYMAETVSGTVGRSEIDDLESVLASTEAIIERVTPEQAHLATPCSEFDVAQLIDHMVGWSASFAARSSSKPFEGDPNDYQAGTDPGGEFHRSAAEIVAGYRNGAEAVPIGILLMDYLGHGWDLAVATAQPVTYGDRAVERALTAGKQMLKPEFRGPGKGFGPEVKPPAEATPMQTLIAFLGRDPGWKPAG